MSNSYQVAYIFLTSYLPQFLVLVSFPVLLLILIIRFMRNPLKI